jgi:eukaryotic-like serine/threonine-protein kinase
MNTGGNAWDPALSPDGHWIAYVSDESGRPEVYVRPFPNAGGGKWQISKDGGWAPLWAHSGRELFYRRRPDGGAAGEPAVLAVTIAAGPAFSVIRQQVLFRDHFVTRLDQRLYDIAPDDSRFLMMEWVQDPTEASVNLVMVEHVTSAIVGHSP